MSNRIFIANFPENFEGESIGTGHCVPFVQKATNPNAPLAKTWKEGARVQGNLSLQYGTAIATFKDGKYPNLNKGNHAAIYIGQDEKGIWVFDQFLNPDGSRRNVGKRYIAFKNGSGSMSADASAYSVIEAP